MELLKIKMLNTAVERIMNRELGELNLTYAQATVIGYLLDNKNKDVCQKDIEYSLGLKRPTVSSILSRMEAGGMIKTENFPSDRRYKKIVLTDKAAGLAESIGEKYREVKRKLFDGVSPEQRELFNAAVSAILKNAETN